MRAELICRSVFVPSPAAGIAAFWGATYYTSLESLDLVSIHGYMTKSDLPDAEFRRTSNDNGRTWSEAKELQTWEQRPAGMFRRLAFAGGGYLDPVSGRYLTFRTQGVLPNDDPLDGMKHYTVHYTVSEDGGRTELFDEQIIQSGEEFNAGHPVRGVWIGKNSMMLSGMSCRPLCLADGTILLPTNITPLGPDGEYYNPGGGYTYSQLLILRGKWRSGKRIDWEASQPLSGDPARNTRGLDEATLGLLADGRILAVIRGSNDTKEHLPGYKWHAFSSDDGVTWTEPKPWQYTDGEVFHSPASCSQLIAHSSGALLWVGNICHENPRGNSPRYPLILGEIDLVSGLLKRESLTTIDDRRDGDSEALQLSNFLVREDRETSELVIQATRLFSRQEGDWTADSLIYRVALHA